MVRLRRSSHFSYHRGQKSTSVAITLLVVAVTFRMLDPELRTQQLSKDFNTAGMVMAEDDQGA
jgi:hypothetical protein